MKAAFRTGSNVTVRKAAFYVIEYLWLSYNTFLSHKKSSQKMHMLRREKMTAKAVLRRHRKSVRGVFLVCMKNVCMNKNTI